MRVFVAPAKVITNQRRIRQLRNAAIKRRVRAQQQREFRARLARQNRIVLAQLASERILFGMKQQRDFIRLRVAVNHPKPALHQMLRRPDHHIPETYIKRRGELMRLAR